MRVGDDEAPDRAHDPKHLALRVFLDHPKVFEAAADHMAMLTADRLHEFAGRERGVMIDLTEAKLEAFLTRIAELFRDAFLGDFCRVGDYVDGDEINLVISHGALVSTMPVVEGERERVISVRAVNHAVLRYSESTGILRMARVRKKHRAEIADLFASIVLDRPGFFDSADACDLYTLEPAERARNNFAFDHRYDPNIDRVEILEAAADVMVAGEDGDPRVAQTFRARDPDGAALVHLHAASATFDGPWRLGELVFRMFLKSAAKRQPQVTVKV